MRDITFCENGGYKIWMQEGKKSDAKLHRNIGLLVLSWAVNVPFYSQIFSDFPK